MCFGAFKIKKKSAFGRKVGYFPPLFSDLPKQGGEIIQGGEITYGTEVIPYFLPRNNPLVRRKSLRLIILTFFKYRATCRHKGRVREGLIHRADFDHVLGHFSGVVFAG